MRQRLDAVILDLDGTIVDSEPLWYASDRSFAQSYGLSFTQDEWNNFIGMGGRALAALIKERARLTEDLETIARLKDEAYLAHAQGKLRAFPEMVKLIKALRLQGLNLAVASGSSLRVIEASLKEVGLRPLFMEIISADEVKNGKPAPDIFFEVARRLEVEPQNCLVIEDSLRGVQAALAAGMACVAVPFDPKHTQAEFQRANLVFQDIAKFKAEKVLEWIDMTYCLCEECEFRVSGRCFDKS